MRPLNSVINDAQTNNSKTLSQLSLSKHWTSSITYKTINEKGIHHNHKNNHPCGLVSPKEPLSLQREIRVLRSSDTTDGPFKITRQSGATSSRFRKHKLDTNSNVDSNRILMFFLTWKHGFDVVLCVMSLHSLVFIFYVWQMPKSNQLFFFRNCIISFVQLIR